MFHDESLKHMLIDHHQGRIIKISRFKIQDSRFFIQELRRTYAQQKQIN
jgi:hypothetical protein